MAQQKRSARARGGGKLALFEVIQAAQEQGQGHLSDAVAPLVAASAMREAPAPEPPPVAAVPAPSPPRKTLVIAAGPGSGSTPEPKRPQQRAGISALSFATGVAGAIAVIGAGLVAFQYFAARPPHQVSGSAPQPEVLDVGGSDSGQTLAKPLDSQEIVAQSQSPASAARVPSNFRRTNGLNYVLVQSYDSSEQEGATAMRDALLRNGIEVTIERDIRGWPGRLAVVGTEGFEHYKTNPEYKAYVQRLVSIERKVISENRKIRKFEPTPVQWDRS